MSVLRLRPSCSRLYVERQPSMSDVRDRVRVRGRDCLAIISVTGHTRVYGEPPMYYSLPA